MSRPDIAIVLVAIAALFSWYAVAHDLRIGRLIGGRWNRLYPYANAYVRASPATFLYAAIIAFTTWVLAGSSGRLSNALLRTQSTNISNLRHHAVDVLLRSAFWSGYPYVLPIIAALAAVLAPAEFWLGTKRAILVFAIGHVGATLLTAAGISLALRLALAPRGVEHSIDVGVSYGTLCIAGVLTYRIPRPWRYVWILGMLTVLGLIAVVDASFSDYGHLVAVALGLCCYPMTRTPRALERSRVPLFRPWLMGAPPQFPASPMPQPSP